MMKAFLRFCALACLCALLVYAPEILTSVAAPYHRTPNERILLRIVLCSQDAQSISSLYKAIADYQKQHPFVHLRIARADPKQLIALPDPLPDVYLFPAALAKEWSGPFEDELSVYVPSAGESLLCGVSADARSQQTAREFIAHITQAAAHETPVSEF